MKRITFFAISLIALSSILWISCGKENLRLNSPNRLTDSKSAYNEDVKKIGQTLSLALANEPELRKVLKEEALKKFDGDYDILFKTLMKKEFSSTNKSNASISFENLLRAYNLDQENMQKSNEEFLQELIDVYPDLQVSIPVNIQNWDDFFIPKVVVLTDDFDEHSSVSVPGFFEGNYLDVDAVEAPDFEPLVVIGRNERMRTNKSFGDPDFDISLVASTWTSSIHLSWTIGDESVSSSTITSYRIFRKDQGSNTFHHVGTNQGISNTTFTDYLLLPNNQYEYYVKAYSSKAQGYSQPSNIAAGTAPDRPNPPVEFEVFQTSLNVSEVRWNYEDDQFTNSANLYRKVEGEDQDYQFIQSFGQDDFYYIDNNVTPGKKITYKMDVSNLMGNSEPKYDFLIAPYRDISQINSVYLSQIQVDDMSDVEHWLHGDPEWELSIASISEDDLSAHFIQESLGYNPDNRETTYYPDGALLFNWDTDYWQNMVSFHLIEHDNNDPQFDFNMTVKGKTKNADKTAFSAEAIATISYEIETERNCGMSYTTYYDQTTKVLEFPAYGTSITINHN